MTREQYEMKEANWKRLEKVLNSKVEMLEKNREDLKKENESLKFYRDEYFTAKLLIDSFKAVLKEMCK